MAVDRTIHFCMRCEAKNRIPAGMEANAKCGNCGRQIYPDQLVRDKTYTKTGRSYARPSEPKAPVPRTSRWSIGSVIKLALVGGLGIFMIGSWLFDNSPPVGEVPIRPSTGLFDDIPITNPPSQSFEQPATQKVAAPAQILPPVQSISTGLQWNRTGRPAAAPFQIVTRGEQDYFVKLVDYYSGADAIAIFVPGGRTVKVDVPFGTYKLRYAAGNDWRGEVDYFGPGDMTSFSASNEMFEFELVGNSARGFTVELYTQIDGNMQTRDIPRSSF